MPDDDDFPMLEEIAVNNWETFGYESREEAEEEMLEKFDWAP